MAKTVVIDELRLTVRVPTDLPGAATERVRRTPLGADFMDRLRRSIRLVFRAFPELARGRVSLTR
jgi:hypothetical protein